MRLFLIFTLFFSSVFDTGLAENDVCAVIGAMSVESTSQCDDGSHFSDFSPEFPDDHNPYDHHKNSCQHCHKCQTRAEANVSLNTPESSSALKAIAYQFSHPKLFYKTLKRPPKLIV